MDGQKFDRITRALAIGADRRAVLKGLAGSALGGALALVGAGARAAPRCRQTDEPCQSHAQCCTQFCPNTTFRCTCPVPCPGATNGPTNNCCLGAQTCCGGQCCGGDRVCCTPAGTTNQQCVSSLCSGGQVFDAATCKCVTVGGGGGACPAPRVQCGTACCQTGEICCPPGTRQAGKCRGNLTACGS